MFEEKKFRKTHPYSILRHLKISILLILLSMLQQILFHPQNILEIIGSLGINAFYVMAILFYYLSTYGNLKYYVDERSIYIREGVFIHRMYRIPKKKICTIVFYRDIISSLFGAEKISIDTPSGSYKKFDMESYLEVYEKDLESANNEIVISSPSLWNNKIERLLEIVRDKQLSGLSVIVITSHPDASLYESSDKRMQMMEMMRAAGIHVYHTDDQCEHFAIIDRSTVWYGSLNFLGKEDIEDNLMRVNSSEIAAELLERTFGDSSEFQNWNQFKQKLQV